MKTTKAYKNLLIVSGAWPTKIFSGLRSEFKDREVIKISDREFFVQNLILIDHFGFI